MPYLVHYYRVISKEYETCLEWHSLMSKVKHAILEPRGLLVLLLTIFFQPPPPLGTVLDDPGGKSLDDGLLTRY